MDAIWGRDDCISTKATLPGPFEVSLSNHERFAGSDSQRPTPNLRNNT